VSTEWRVDAYPFKIPCVAHPSDATMSPQSAIALGRLGGLGVLNAEGLWTRYEDPTKILEELASLGEDADATKRLQEVYAEPIKPELIAERVKTIRDGGVTVAVRVSPQHTLALAPVVLDAGVDLLVIQGTIISAEHVSRDGEPLNLKSFIADQDVPVIVGGCSNYQTATHLMRTGAAGVIVGYGAGSTTTTDGVLGISVPMATAIADASAARRAYLDETGGRYVHVIADGDMQTSADVIKAIACGADAVMLGEQLTAADGVPGDGFYWVSVAGHPQLPRGHIAYCGTADTPLETLLLGPASSTLGDTNVFGALRRAMAKTGYSDLKEFQKVGLAVQS
jgi:IMP dehydrogenase